RRGSVPVLPRLSYLPSRARQRAGFARFTDHKTDASNGLGNRSFSLSDSRSPRGLVRIISIFPQSSHKIWRQAPHGGVSVAASAAITMRRNSRAPSEIALN